MSAWLAAAECMGQDPVVLQRSWPPRLLRRCLAWIDGQMNEPTLTDHLLMRLAWLVETGGNVPYVEERYRLRFGRGPAQQRKVKTPDEQRAEDKVTSALWRGIIDAQQVKKEAPK